MNTHMATRSRVPASIGMAIETKKDGEGNKTETPSETKKAITEVMTAFEEFKSANDARLKELEAKGAADPISVDKLDKINKHLDKFEDLNKRVATAEGVKKALDDLQEQFDEMETALARRSTADTPEAKAAELKQRVNDWGRGVVDAYAKGEANLTDDQRKALQDVRDEYKALSVGQDTTGGYLAPVDYVREIIKSVTEMSPARSLARVRTTGMKSISQPKRTGQFSAVRVAEQGPRSETDGLRWGNVEIPAPEAYALIDISEQNLEDSFWDLEAELREEASEQFAVLEGAEFVSGSGVGEAQGILIHDDVAVTNSGEAAAITADGLLSLKYGIKTAYARNASFALNRSTMGAVRRLKDGNGQYLWMPGIAMGRPNTIDGDPYVECPDMPNVQAGAFPVAYGDFRKAYTMADRVQMTLLRDPYTQATSGNVRFLFRRRFGGQVVLAEAIRKLKIAA